MGKVISTSNSVGGAGSSATSGGYNQGNQIAAQHKSGNSGVGSGDVRGGSAKSGGYNQGSQAAAQHKSGNSGVDQSKDIRGGSAGSGCYNQGAQK
jgi:hypothetical protein